MVPGIAEREIRLHADHRQDWLQSESSNRTRATIGGDFGARAALGSALIQARRAIGNLVGRKAVTQPQPELSRAVLLEAARH